MLGTLINIVAVLAGSSIGLFTGNRLPTRIQETILAGVGLVTLLIGFEMALRTQYPLVVLGSVIAGGIIGELLRIEDGLNAAGAYIERRTSGFGKPHPAAGDAEEQAPQAKSTAYGFVTASLIFCVGPLTVVGCILDGMLGDYRPLAIKSMLDGITSFALSTTLGIGVLFSALTILVYQGGLSLAAMGFGSMLTGITQESPALIEMTATGGVLIIGIGLLILDLKRVRVSNFLPALVIAPGVMWLLGYFGVIH